MIKHTCNNIEEYLEHIKKIDIKYMQLKKGVFLNELISVSNNEIMVWMHSSHFSEFKFEPEYFSEFKTNSNSGWVNDLNTRELIKYNENENIKKVE